MLQHETSTETAIPSSPAAMPRPADQIRVSPEELTEAIAALEGQRLDTISLGEAVNQLGLHVTADELLAQIEARRARKATEEAIRGKTRGRRWFTRIFLASILVPFALICFV